MSYNIKAPSAGDTEKALDGYDSGCRYHTRKPLYNQPFIVEILKLQRGIRAVQVVTEIVWRRLQVTAKLAGVIT